MDKRFGSLRFIGTVFKTLAWVALVLGILGGLIMIVMGIVGGLGGAAAMPRGEMGPGGLGALTAMTGVFGGLMGGVLTVVASVLYFLFLYAVGDAIFLALAIEENTRETAYYLKGGDYLRRV